MLFGLTNSATSAEKADLRWFWRVLWLSLGARALLALLLPLGVDEAYMLAAAREFSLSFFDHPPLGFWSPVLATILSGVEHPFIYRIPTLIYGTLTMGLLYGIGREIGNRRTGLLTAVLYAISPMFFVAGVAVLPDGPLSVGSAFCVLWLVRIAKSTGPVPLAHWVYVGAGLAVALASKYQAALIPVATLVFMLATPAGRRWFLQPGIYLAALIGLLGLLPVLLWNMQNGWASFVFHGARTGNGLNPGNFATMLLGQAVYLLPPVLMLAIIGIWRGVRCGRPEQVLLAYIALAPILAFNAIYLISNQSFPHWTMPGWIFALPLAGLFLAQLELRRQRRYRTALIGFGAPMLVLLALLAAHTRTGILTRFLSPTPPAWDQTQDVFDYSPMLKILTERGDLQGVDLIASRNWITAGFMSTGLQGNWPIRVLSDPKHHFYFMQGEAETGVALLLDPRLNSNVNKALPGLMDVARRIDPQAVALKPIRLNRGGIPYITVNVIRLRFRD